MEEVIERIFKDRSVDDLDVMIAFAEAVRNPDVMDVLRLLFKSP